MLPSGFFEPFIENVCLGLVFSLSVQHVYGMSFFQVFALHELVWFVSDASLLYTIEKVCMFVTA